MRATWLGARSGRMATTTLPCEVSSTSLSSLICLLRQCPLLSFSGFTTAKKASLGVGRHLHAHDAVRIGDGTIPSRVALLDLVDGVHAGHDLAHDRVLIVEAGVLGEHDEELAVGRVGVLRARHADDAALERHIGEL